MAMMTLIFLKKMSIPGPGGGGQWQGEDVPQRGRVEGQGRPAGGHRQKRGARPRQTQVLKIPLGSFQYPCTLFISKVA